MVLSNGMAKTSHWAALYFVALMTFGNYVLFNLLVAILVEGFSAERNERREREQREAARIRRQSMGAFSAYSETSRSASDSTDSYGQVFGKLVQFFYRITGENMVKRVLRPTY